jgi:hypothetical protein
MFNNKENMKKIVISFLILTCLGIGLANAAIIDNPLPWETLKELGDALLDGLMYVAGGIFVLLIILAGIKLMSSFGNPEELKKAKNTIWYCSLGLIVLIASKAIYNFVFDVINSK